ncbi:MAG: phosphoribosyl-AMP cyclohydrolase [Planctomycetes bacterium]|nr:phosphoribosyl-AMP cyclohydrolase [Planctomycetota bacterium]
MNSPTIEPGPIDEPAFGSADGLLPAIAQDADSGRVLMLAYMNRESFAETVRTGKAVYYSRSRQRLWVKGEESGHFQQVVEIRIDCDADAILLKVRQTGAACHEGYASCFFRALRDGRFETTEQRLADPATIYNAPPRA